MENKDIKQQVEERLASHESKRKVQDVGRVALSKKELAAYRIVSMANIDEINEDSIIAFNLVKKESVWESIDIDQQKLQGVSSGAAFIKLKIREALPAKPANDANKRKAYVNFLNVLQKDLLPLKTVKDVETAVEQYVKADVVKAITYFIDPMYDTYSEELKEKTKSQWMTKNGIRWMSSEYFNKKLMEELFGVKFVNVITKNSDAGHTAWQMAELFEASEGSEKEYRDRQVLIATNHLAKRRQEFEEIARLDTNQFYAYVSTRYKVESLKRFSNPEDIFVNEAYWRKNYERWYKDAEQKYEKAISGNIEVPAYYKKREDDWSWSVKETSEGEAKERGRQVNKKVPLDYIKRTNGYKTPEPTPQNIVDLYGFVAYNFGNYVPDNERAEHARHFVGALTDLGEILNIDIAQVHRMVGFGFGVGLKGYGGHLATYFPQTKDINLVRGKGDGSVAHEWGHFFDNLLADFSEKKAIPSWGTSGEAKDPELKRLFQELITIFKDGVKGVTQYKIRTVNAIELTEKTDYPEIEIKGSIEESLESFFTKNPRLKYLRLKDTKFWVEYRLKYLGYIIAKHDLPSYDIKFVVSSLYYDDSYFVGNPKYWVSNVEMFARAFETYVFHKLAKKDMANNYLAHDSYLEENMPYPRGVEYEAIEKLMDAIFIRFKQAYNIADFKPIINERMGEEIIELTKKPESVKPKVEAKIEKGKGKSELIVNKETVEDKTTIKADNVADLIVEAATKNYRKVKVVFNPAYDESLHGSLKNEKLIESLKTSKVEIFDVIEEASAIIDLLKNKKDIIQEIVFIDEVDIPEEAIEQKRKKVSVIAEPKAEIIEPAPAPEPDKEENVLDKKSISGEEIKVGDYIFYGTDPRSQNFNLSQLIPYLVQVTGFKVIGNITYPTFINPRNPNKKWEYPSKEYTIIKDGAELLAGKTPDKKTKTDMVYTIARHREVMDDTYEGRISLEDFKAAFEQALSSRDALKAELSNYKKDDLLKMVGGMSAYRLKSEKKDYVVDSVADDIVEFFALGSFSYTFGQDRFAGVRSRVEKFTQEDLKKFSEEVLRQREEHKQHILKYKAAIADPKTLEDFKIFFEYKGKDKMTDEQKVLYDELVALDTKEKQKEKIEDKAEISQVRIGDVSMTMAQTKHTKTGADLFVVKLSERVSPDTYKELNAKAKQLGGWYSSYSKDGAIPGFQFKEKSQAEKFMSLKEGSVSNLEQVVERQEEKAEKRVNKLRENAEKIIEKADEELGRERLANTARRAAMASSIESRLNSEKATAKIMLKIADAIDSGEVKFLDKVSTKAQVEQLRSIVSGAKYRYIEEKLDRNYEDHKYDDPTVEMADYINKYQYFFPELYKEHWLKAAKEHGSRPGMKLLSERINKMLLHASSDPDRFKVSNKYQMEEILEFADKLPEDWDTKNIKEVAKDHRRLKSMGIESDEMLRAVVREFISFSVGTTKANDKVKELERGLAGRKVGFDYFPTPPALAGKMAALLEASDGMSVLEPSAGNGNLADAVKNLTGISCDVIEISGDLRAILEAKGYNVVAHDFTDYAEKKYDRIIMNPPFSNRMDGEHVQHAFDLLNPGGRIVAIMGEGIFFGSDKKAVAFREWADELNAEIEELPKNTFMDRTQTSTTGANARLVVIDKKGEVVKKEEDVNQWQSLKELCDVMIPSESEQKEWSNLSDLCDMMIGEEKFGDGGGVDDNYNNPIPLIELVSEFKKDRNFNGYSVLNMKKPKKLIDVFNRIFRNKNINNFRFLIRTIDMRHIIKEHGDKIVEENRGQYQITPDDFLNLPSILSFPDDVVGSGKTKKGTEAIKITKNINGVYYCIEEVFYKTEMFNLVTLYKKK